ncbi:MAG: REDY-like protein HapK [Alphaproteobacteria bacterium]|nr:MAG: REDY-like protein HapK [Alphaproteobacteria bacterium]
MRIIALFNLKPDVAIADYESWAAKSDMPGVRSLVSVKDFNVYRTTGLLFADGAPPYQYVEILDITHMDEFQKDCASDLVSQLGAELANFADNAVFMTTELMMEG